MSKGVATISFEDIAGASLDDVASWIIDGVAHPIMYVSKGNIFVPSQLGKVYNNQHKAAVLGNQRGAVRQWQ